MKALDEILKLRAKATPGPWQLFLEPRQHVIEEEGLEWWPDGKTFEVVTFDENILSENPTYYNVAFSKTNTIYLVTLANNIEAIAEYVRRLEVLLKEAKETLGSQDTDQTSLRRAIEDIEGKPMTNREFFYASTGQEIEAALRKAWDDNGACNTCGWFSAFYEVAGYLEPEDDTLDEWHAGCLSPGAYENGDHKGCYIYPKFGAMQ